MKILMIAQAFAPVGGSHAVRVTNVVKALSEMGHEVTVLSATSGNHKPETDLDLLRKVPASVRVIRAFHGPMHEMMYRKPCRAGGGTGSSTKGLKGLLCPDTYIEWFPFALCQLLRLARRYRPDVIVSSASPYTSHLVGLAAKRLFGVPWVVDSGDPWVYEPMHQRTGWRLLVERRMESAVLNNCDWFTVTTGPTLELYAETYPVTIGKTSVISMGFAPEDYPERDAAGTGAFRFVHTGRLTAHRDGSSFLAAVAQMQDELRGRAEFHFYGGIPAPMLEQARQEGIADLLVDGGWLHNSECMSALRNAGALLLFGNSNAIQVPGKLFNYLGSGTPLLYLKNHAHREDACAEIIGRYPCAAAANDVGAVKDAIRTAMTLTRGEGCGGEHSWTSKAAAFQEIFAGLVQPRSR
ncbi:glycosyltransferase [Geomonas oryzisoli]|uniref:Glycosyltransferase n=1 Tax=Geomonas oryzisoli TaxID=2847992 RepID=A0ABX8JBM2_9BACT|nr:glycosyltransferase [Geomonas oryzisoli]QWV94802.1 glycosyltransferase [Geomonas oryzisoli]